jgi:hypothetical protein
MNCPHCKSDTKVIDSRMSYLYVRRRRQCLKCNWRFTTKEIYAPEQNVPQRITMPILPVKFCDLTKIDKAYLKRACMMCSSGALSARRNIHTLKFERFDMCSSCGQRYEYVDFKSAFANR